MTQVAPSVSAGKPTLDLGIEEETFLAPGVITDVTGAGPEGTATFTTTCWSCSFTCGDCTPVPSWCNC